MRSKDPAFTRYCTTVIGLNTIDGKNYNAFGQIALGTVANANVANLDVVAVSAAA